MNQGAAKLQVDDLLLPFLVAGSEAESEVILEELVPALDVRLITVMWRAGSALRPRHERAGPPLLHLYRSAANL